jgi:hypothetical protein
MEHADRNCFDARFYAEPLLRPLDMEVRRGRLDAEDYGDVHCPTCRRPPNGTPQRIVTAAAAETKRLVIFAVIVVPLWISLRVSDKQSIARIEQIKCELVHTRRRDGT